METTSSAKDGGENPDLDVPEELELFLTLPAKPENFRIIGMLHHRQILMEHAEALAVADTHNIHKALIESLLTSLSKSLTLLQDMLELSTR